MPFFGRIEIIKLDEFTISARPKRRQRRPSFFHGLTQSSRAVSRAVLSFSTITAAGAPFVRLASCLTSRLLTDPTRARLETASGATTRVQKQNPKRSYDANLGYDTNSARFPVRSEDRPKTALQPVVACANGTTAVILTTVLAKFLGFLRR